MQSASNARDKIKVADVVVSTNHVNFLANRFPRLISLPTSDIFISRTSGITAILKYRSVNPIYIYYLNVTPTQSIKNICGRSPHGVVTKAPDSDFVVSEFERQSRYYVHFRPISLGKV